MDESFDPYHKWLAIPPEDQPPSHYRLLAIESGEQDEEVISNAAEQRISHLRILEMGEQGGVASQLIEEIQLARDCLLGAETRAVYEEQSARESSEPSVEFDEELPREALVESLDKKASANTTASKIRAKKASDKKAKKISLIGHIVAPIVGLAIGGVILYVIKSMPTEKEDPTQIGFEIGSMRDADSAQQGSIDSDADSEQQEAESPDNSGARLPNIHQSVADALPDEAEQAELNQQNEALETSGAEDLQAERVTLTEPDSLNETVVNDVVNDHAEASPSAASTNDDLADQQAMKLERERRGKEAALTAAVESGNLMMQLKIANEIAMLDNQDSWDREVKLFEDYKIKASQSDQRSIVQAAMFLSQRAQKAGLNQEARALAGEALRSARNDGSPELTRMVTTYILQSSFAEGE